MLSSKTSLLWQENTLPKTEDKYLDLMSAEEVAKAVAFHKTIPGYQATPLQSLTNMAAKLGVKNIFVKDESQRFDLKAFKVLGGSFAMAKYIAGKLGCDVSELDFETLTSEETRAKLGPVTFVTATDGNHGRGVAWSANRLGQKAVVFMPEGTTQNRLNNILEQNAAATIEPLCYDDCVRKAATLVETLTEKGENAVLIQDTAWDGYEEIPSFIMQGYGTMLNEANEQMHTAGIERPTHVFVQAGVGSLAGAVQGYFVNQYPENPPVVCVVEADNSACHYESAKLGDGTMVTVESDKPTIMAGLNCGTPSPVSWDLLRNHATAFVSASDEVSANAMRKLAFPMDIDQANAPAGKTGTSAARSTADPAITSGESGAAGFGVFYEAMTNPACSGLKDLLDLNENSSVLCISTEGNTDPDKYNELVFGA